MNNENNLGRKTVPEPLLFIHSVSTPILSNGSQRYFDSRDPATSKNTKTFATSFHRNFSEEKEMTTHSGMDELLFKKIQNIVQMYGMNHPIPTLIETKHNESYEGIPYQIENETLYIKQNETHLEIPLSDIQDAIILKI